ncbi:MAG: toll/interleukin-1 receptor domain-containing protein [Phototrophicaceae bacterium]|jgi:hypothetical protein
MSKIFVSYSRVDEPIMDQLVLHLRRVYGHDAVWVDENLRGGQAWWQEICRQIGLAEVFVILVSPESMASTYCQQEINEALRLGRTLIPVLVRDRTVVPPNLKQYQLVKMTHGITVENLTELSAGINLALNQYDARTIPNRMTVTRTQPMRGMFTGAAPSNIVIPSPLPPASGHGQAAPVSANHSAPTVVGKITSRHIRVMMSVVPLLVIMAAMMGWWFGRPSATPTVTPNAVDTRAPQFVAEFTTVVPTPSIPQNGLILYYDSQTLSLVNIGAQPIDASGIRFIQTGTPPRQYDADEWNNGNRLGQLAPGECYQMWTVDISFAEPPPTCTRRLRWRQSANPLAWFWQEGASSTFQVWRGGMQVATCNTGAGECRLGL